MLTDGLDEPHVGARRGWTLRRRFFALDSFGLLLVMIMLSLTVSALSVPSGAILSVIRTLVLGGTLAFALHTSGARRGAYAGCAAFLVLAVVAASVLGPDSQVGLGTEAIAAFLLISSVLVTVARRFVSHPVVTSSSILAAICIYLFVGLAFASIYAFVAAVDPAGLFVGSSDGTSAERIYFSYITLTTTGYGDFVPASDPSRMTAVTEALLGQVYLVTIVALLVANVGARRRRPAGDG
jgi:voltage-gated potassium channel Kch